MSFTKMMITAAAALIVTSGPAFAHGPAAQQASDAIKVASEMFIASADTNTRRAFQSISAEITGHEQFAVTIMLRDGTTKFNYDCRENEDVEPVVWECTAL